MATRGDGTAPPAEAAKSAGHADLARALALSMAMAQRSIVSGSVDRVVLLSTDTEFPGYVIGWEEFDGIGRWSSQTMVSVGSREARHPTTFDESEVFDGEIVHGWNERERGGLVHDDTGRYGANYPFRQLAGMREDSFGLEGTGELLLKAPDLRMDFGGRNGRPRLIGRAFVPPRVITLRVEVDPEHGFLPSRIEALDHLLKNVAVEKEIDGFEQRSGVWAPVSGWRRDSVRDWTPEQSRRFFARVRELGVEPPGDPLEPRVEQVHLAALREVFGAEESPSRLDGIKRIQYGIRSLNEPADPTRHFAGWPVDYRVYDEFRHAMKERGAMEWRGEKPAGEGR